MMKSITNLELLTLRDVLLSMLEEDDVNEDDIKEALEIVEALLRGEEVIMFQGDDE